MSQSWHIMEIQLSHPTGAWAGFCILVANTCNIDRTAPCAGAGLWHVWLQKCGLTSCYFTIFIGNRARYVPSSREGEDAKDVFTPW